MSCNSILWNVIDLSNFAYGRLMPRVTVWLKSPFHTTLNGEVCIAVWGIFQQFVEGLSLRH